MYFVEDFIIERLHYYPDTNIVFAVQYRINFDNLVNAEVNFVQTCYIPYPVDNNYVPLENLTYDTVKQWILTYNSKTYTRCRNEYALMLLEYNDDVKTEDTQQLPWTN